MPTFERERVRGGEPRTKFPLTALETERERVEGKLRETKTTERKNVIKHAATKCQTITLSKDDI